MPIGAITIIVITLFFKAPERATISSLGWKERIQQLDLLGTAVFVPTIVTLLLALQWGGTKYAWGSWRIIVLFVLFGILMAIFIGIRKFSVKVNGTYNSSNLFT